MKSKTSMLGLGMLVGLFCFPLCFYGAVPISLSVFNVILLGLSVWFTGKKLDEFARKTATYEWLSSWDKQAQLLIESAKTFTIHCAYSVPATSFYFLVCLTINGEKSLPSDSVKEVLGGLLVLFWYVSLLTTLTGIAYRASRIQKSISKP